MGVLSGEADYVRIVHLKHWERERNRFYPFAFKRSSKSEKDPDGGVSLVSAKCVRSSNKSLCEHLRYYYPPSIVSEPPVFLCITEEELPDCELKQKTSESGDVCHYNLVGWSHGRCTKFLETFWKIPEKLVICLDGERHLTLQDIEDWHNGKFNNEASTIQKSPSFYEKYIKPMWHKIFGK